MLKVVVRTVWSGNWVAVTLVVDVEKGDWMLLEKKQASEALVIGNLSRSAPQCSVVCSSV